MSGKQRVNDLIKTLEKRKEELEENRSNFKTWNGNTKTALDDLDNHGRFLSYAGVNILHALKGDLKSQKNDILYEIQEYYRNRRKQISGEIERCENKINEYTERVNNLKQWFDKDAPDAEWIEAEINYCLSLISYKEEEIKRSRKDFKEYGGYLDQPRNAPRLKLHLIPHLDEGMVIMDNIIALYKAHAGELKPSTAKALHTALQVYPFARYGMKLAGAVYPVVGQIALVLSLIELSKKNIPLAGEIAPSTQLLKACRNEINDYYEQLIKIIDEVIAELKEYLKS